MVKPLARFAPLVTDSEEIARAMGAWRASGSIGDLADVLAFGVDGSVREMLTEPARATLRHAGSTAAMRLVAQEILEGAGSQEKVWRIGDHDSDVRSLRALLRLVPRDSIALVDLAQHHLAHGKIRSAYRALTTAYQVSPNSPFVVRAFARYWIHIGQPDRAHEVIKSTGLVSTDPWVMASEIAIAQVAQKPSTQLRKAQKALANKAFKPVDLSELAGAVAGAEIYGGNFKEARKLFRMALDQPNDNVLAQAITSQNFIGIEVDDSLLRRAPNGAFEGRALNAMISGDFEQAVKFTALWSEEEAFSSRPRMLQSYFYGALGEYERSLEAADFGLMADADDVPLRGNRAYALAGLGRFAEAEAELKILDSKGVTAQRPSLLATKGMVLMLSGQADEGIKLYDSAIEALRNAKQEERVTDCMAFMARTAATANIEQRDAILKRATERFAERPSPAASVILRSMNQAVAKVENPELRKVVQWEWDPAGNTLTEKRGLTRKGAPSIVIAEKRK